MKLGVILAALAGLGGAAYLLFVVGFDAVWHAIAQLGWRGYAALWMLGAANFVLLGSAWALLVPPDLRARAATFWWSRAVRDSAGDCLPFSQIGGMVIGARAAILRGIAPSLAFGSMVVDVTIEMVSQISFIAAGALVFMLELPVRGQQAGVIEAAALAIVLGLVGAGGFVVAQRRGFKALERISARMLPKAAAYAAETNNIISAIHGQPRRMVGGFAIHFAGWTVSGLLTWLILIFMGRPLPFGDAIAVEALLCALRSAAVFIPGAIGVQEAGYALLLPLFGVPADIGVALSLVRRAQQIGVGIPVLLSWQIAEGGHAASKKQDAMKASP